MMKVGFWIAFMLLCQNGVQAQRKTAVQPQLPANVSGYAFKDTAAQHVSLAQFKGNYVFVEIWSMSCIPCLREMPFVKKLKEKYQDEPISFVAICVDNNEEAWKGFLRRRNFTGNHWLTPIMSPFLKDNQFIAVPRFVLLDKEGNVLWRRAKYPSDPQLQVELDELFRS